MTDHDTTDARAARHAYIAVAVAVIALIVSISALVFVALHNPNSDRPEPIRRTNPARAAANCADTVTQLVRDRQATITGRDLADVAVDARTITADTRRALLNDIAAIGTSPDEPTRIIGANGPWDGHQDLSTFTVICP